jgi:hypothetical protein
MGAAEAAAARAHPIEGMVERIEAVWERVLGDGRAEGEMDRPRLPTMACRLAPPSERCSTRHTMETVPPQSPEVCSE